MHPRAHHVLLSLLCVALALAASPLAAQSGLRTEGPPQPSVEGDPLDMAIKSLSSLRGAPQPRSTPLAAPSATPGKTTAFVAPSFEGFGFDDNRTENLGFAFIPPDPIGAAGQTRVIAVVNSMIESRTREGLLDWRMALFGFFDPLVPQSFPFDPKIVYDDHADRFVVVALELLQSGNAIDPDNVSRILLAVSKNGKPKTGSGADWWFHAIDSKDLFAGLVELWADYPGFEVDEEAVYITANMFAYPPFSGYGGARLWIVDKAGFYAGAAATVTVHDPYADEGVATTTMPAQVHGAGGVGGPGSTLGTFLVSYSGLSDGTLEYVQVVTVDDPLGAVGGPFFLQEFIPLGNIEGPFPALTDAPQLGGPARIEVNDRRALDAVWRDDALWLTTTISPNSGGEAGQTTAYWVALDTSAGPGGIALADQGGIGGEDIAPGTFTFFPAVAANSAGAVRFGFSASAPTIYAGAYAAGRDPGDAAGTVGPSITIHEGEDYYHRTFSANPAFRNRWGDYSGIAVDPVNDKFFWVFNEFADQQQVPPDSLGQAGRWGTAWGRIK